MLALRELGPLKVNDVGFPSLAFRP
jgi:hypothetical protein